MNDPEVIERMANSLEEIAYYLSQVESYLKSISDQNDHRGQEIEVVE